MTNLLNRFIICGTLSEVHISMFPTHTRCKIAMQVNEAVYTVYYNYNLKWHKDNQLELIKLIPNLHGIVDGDVTANNELYYKCQSSDVPVKLFVSGNLSFKDNKVYFNAMYVHEFDMNEDSINISIEAVPIGNNQWMSIVNDSPRIFKTNYNIHKSNEVYHLELDYNVPYKSYNLKNEKFKIIDSNDTDNKLIVKSIVKTKKCLNEDDIKNWLLEWEIINKEND